MNIYIKIYEEYLIKLYAIIKLSLVAIEIEDHILNISVEEYIYHP